jgi:hypothetical protein
VLSREKEFRGKKTDFYNLEKLENMVDKAKEYDYKPLRENDNTLPLPKGHRVKYKNTHSPLLANQCSKSRKGSLGYISL